MDHQKSTWVPEKHLILLYWLHQCLRLCGSQLWEILKEMGIPDDLTCLLRNLHEGQEETDWFQIWKGVRQGCILLLCLFNLYAECILWNARLDEAKDGIKISRRNINKLRYADDTTQMGESEEELKSFLLNMKEENEKVDLKLNTQNTKIMESMLNNWRKNRHSDRLYFLGLQNHCGWLQPWN